MDDTVRLHLDWFGGSVVGPSSTTLHFYAVGLTIDATAVQSLVDQAHTGLQGTISNTYPAGVSIVVRPTVEYFDHATGKIGEEITAATAPAGVTGIASGPYSGTSGAVASLKTNSRIDGRSVRGRAFIVPLGGQSYDNGQVSAAARGAIAPFFTGLFTTACGPLSIWSPNTKGGTNGVISPVTAVSVPGLPAVLRSRRQ